MKMVWEGAVGTAKRIRKILKAKFPGIKFSVRSHSYSGGSSVDVKWTDGPMTEEVEKLIKPLQSATFDGMIDLESHVAVPGVDENGEVVDIVGAKYIFATREKSPEYAAKLDSLMTEKYGPEGYKELKDDGGPRYWHWLNETEKEMKAAGKL
jgi:hypothetical protein